ncbi:uncharacterized protein [Amphiura filiformis]|uniref:uncharacterized protein n=1 Tax=Amphiura filiformis TaxID=82378 RepID=UPI003B2120C3
MIVNANGTVVPNPLLSKVITTQPSVVIPTSVPPLTEAAKNAKLSKAFSPEVLNIAKEVMNRTPVTIVQPQVPKANAETEQVKRSKLSKAFSNDVLSTVIKVAKENEDQERKAELYRTRRSGVLSSTVSESVSETLSTTETNESVTSDTTENSNDASQGDDSQDAANSTSAAPGDSGDASPPILVTIREASETGSIDTQSSEEEQKSMNASQSTVASIPKSPTTRSKAKEIATTSPSTPVKVLSPNTRSASKEIADTSSSTPSGSKGSSLSTRSASKEVTTTSPSTSSKVSSPSTRSVSAPSKEVTTTSPSTPSKASLPGTRSASKKASPDVTSPLSDTPVRSTTRSKGNLMSKLISTGALGTQSDFEEEEEDDDFDPEVVSSDWDSDEERSSSRLQKSPRTKSSDEKSRKKKSQKKKSREETVPAPPPVLPKLTLAPNVTVPTSVVDRIQSMITDNTSLLTTLDEEEEEKKKKPKEPKVKHDPSKESVEARISKAFNADVLSSVLAVKQELAKRPKIPDMYAAPMQTAPALNVLYTLPGGGQVLLPAGSFLPVAQRPVVVNPITQLAPGMTLVPVSTATPVKVGDKSSTAEDSNAAPSGKMKGKGKKQETKEGKKSKGKKESKGKKDTEENEATKNAKSKNKSVKDQAKGTKKSVVDDDDVNKEPSSNQEEIVVRKSARKRSVVMPDTETVTMDDSPTSPKSGSEKLTGARKRKASLLAKQGENAAAKEHAKKIKVENEGSGLSSGRTTRAKRSETKGSDKRVESTGTGKRIRTLKVKMNL